MPPTMNADAPPHTTQPSLFGGAGDPPAPPSAPPAADAPALEAQASRLERALPQLNRQLFATYHPLAEMPLAQLRLCSLLLHEGRRTMSQIGEELGISVSAVTQMADRLEKAGMVERVAEPGGDRRTRHLQLTAHGSDLMRSRREMRMQRAAAVLARLEPEARAAAMRALDALVEACDAEGYPAPPPGDETPSRDSL